MIREGKKERISPFQRRILSQCQNSLPSKVPSFLLFLFSFSHLLLFRGGKKNSCWLPLSPKWVTRRLPNESCQSAERLGARFGKRLVCFHANFDSLRNATPPPPKVIPLSSVPSSSFRSQPIPAASSCSFLHFFGFFFARR